MSAETADWCIDAGNLTIHGTTMREDFRRSEGISWCFHCRTRHEFFFVVMVPDGPSYYDPYCKIVGLHSECSDLFPGRYRVWDDES